MKNVISLNDRLKLDKEKKAFLIKWRKLLSARKVLQCTQCALKCSKCGTQIMSSDKDDKQRRLPYRLCESCSDEYREYTSILQGGEGPSCYWHNKEWMDVWKTWIAYQESLRRYRNSKEFLDLLKELEGPERET